MSKNYLWLSILAVLISFAGGFLLANALNRSEMNNLLAENNRLKKEPLPDQNSSQAPQESLTEQEIREKLTQAEKNPDDFNFQKGLGIGLYRYAAMKQDPKLLQETAQVLERAYLINPNDYDVLVSLGNIYYDVGQLEKSSENNKKAREIYSKALAKNPQDTFVRTDYGLTFLLTENPEREKAIEELEKALEANPKNQKALYYISQALIETGKVEKAREKIAILKQMNPKSPGVGELEKLIAQTENE